MPKQSRTKITRFGLPFDSKVEAERYEYLLKAQAKGQISELEARKECLEVVLQASTKLPKNCLRPKAETIRKISYTPDFRYILNGVQVIEDMKGAYGNSRQNKKLNRVGKPIVSEAAHLRHKLMQAKLPHVVFRLLVNPKLDVDAREGYF
jgi:hypothetical protein